MAWIDADSLDLKRFRLGIPYVGGAWWEENLLPVFQLAGDASRNVLTAFLTISPL